MLDVCLRLPDRRRVQVEVLLYWKLPEYMALLYNH